MPDGQIVFKHGDKPDGFYIMFKGRVKVTRPGEKKGEEEISLPGLLWEIILAKKPCLKTATAPQPSQPLKNCVLLFLSRAGF